MRSLKTRLISSKFSRPQARSRLFLKLAFPTAASLLIGTIILWPTAMQALRKMPIGFIPALTSQKQSAALYPHYQGTDKEGQTILIAAERAVEDGQQRYRLIYPKLEYQLHSGQHVLITAKTGFYWIHRKTFDMEGDVHLIHASGYDLTTKQATIDMSQGHIHGTEPIEGSGPTGILKGRGFDILEKGNRLIIHHLRLQGS